MVVFGKITTGMAVSSVLFSSTFAHPGETLDLGKVKRESLFRGMVAAQNRRSLESCLGSSGDQALKQRAVRRREAQVRALRQKRGISQDKPMLGLRPRDEAELSSYAEVDHESSEAYDLSTDPSTLFAQNATCVVVPEVTIGPYWVSGELIRQDITDGEEGVPIHVDVQFVDVNTCEGVSDLLIDMWHCNAMGIYSGVEASGGLNTTFNRGIQQTDSDGVVEFDSIYPGHYTGRTTHIHIKTTADATILDNNTYVDGVTRHIGQFFFDQDLTTLVEETSPYSTNEQELTVVTDDSIAAEEATEEYDPFLKYVLLDEEDISQGLLMWITVGIDTSADYEDAVSAAAQYQEGGGVSLDTGNSGAPGGDGPGGNGPGGEFPGDESTTASASADEEATTVTATSSTTAGASSNSTTTGSLTTSTVETSAGRRRANILGLWYL